MSLASGARVQLAYIFESVHGVTPTPTPAMKMLRSTGRNINPKKAILESNEVRADRLKADVRHGFNSVLGELPFELACRAYDDWLEAALSGTWTAVTVTGTPSLQMIASTAKIVRATGSWLTDLFRPGDMITTTGFTASANNGTFRVVSVTGTDLEIEDTGVTLVDQASGVGTVVYPGKRLDIGTTLRTATVERGFLDIAQYQVYRGVAANGLTVKVDPGGITTAGISLLGMAADPMTGTPLKASPAAAPTDSPFDAFTGQMTEGAALISIVTGLDIALANNRALAGVVGSKFSPDVFEGGADVTGNMTAFFQDAVLYNKFINETETSLWMRLQAPNLTDWMSLVLPRVKYLGGDMDPPANGPVPISLPYKALVHGTTGACFTIQRSNAS